MNTRSATLGEICEFNYGKSLPASQRQVGNAKVYGSNGSVGTHFEALLEGPAIIVGRKGSYGEVHFSDGPLWPIDTTYYIDEKSTDCDLRWLHYLLKFLPLTTLNKSAAIPGLNREDAYRLPVSVPSLDEQRRIAAILDKADDLRRKRKRALELLDGLTQSIFLEMFGDLEVNSKGWDVLPFDTVVSIDAPLVDPKLDKYSRLLHYGPDRIEKDTGRLLVAQTALQDGLISNKFLCSNGQILYSKIRPYLNKVALCDTECLCSADVYPISINSEIADRSYIWFLLRSKVFLKYSESCSNRANIPKINREQFLRYEAPVPPLELQRQFAKRLDKARRFSANADTSEIMMDLLFSSLQSRAFSGQL